MVEFNPVAEPRIAEAFVKSLQRLAPARVKKILATTDFSELSLEGVEYAIALAEEFDASVTLVNVVQPTVHLAGMEAVVIGRGDDEIVELEKRHLSMIAKKISKDRPLRTISRYGKAYREITEVAREINADLIVTTTHGNTGMKRALIGSTAEWIVRYAPCPVLVIPSSVADRKGATWSANIQKILVPVDFSEASIGALPYASALAERFGAGLALVHVAEIPPNAGFDYIPAATVHEDMVKSAEKLLERIQKEVFPEVGRSEAVVVSGTPYHEITRAAQRMKADMIVLTTHGRTGLKHILLGSTAERVVRYAKCPVLAIRQKAGKGATR